jgi:hypothetical protein
LTPNTDSETKYGVARKQAVPRFSEQRFIALPQKSKLDRFGFASCFEAWLCPARGRAIVDLGYALDAFSV